MLYKSLAGKHRNVQTNFILGLILAAVAGAVNAGGFFLIAQYTSHMTGLISLAADSAAIGEYVIALKLLGYILCFIAGAICTTMITLYAQRHCLHSRFALPLLLEALVLTAFSLCWIIMTPQDDQIFYFIPMLCFVMGLQNALITKISSAVIRTTHITGMATDLGIEIGRLFMADQKHAPTSTKNNIGRHTLIIIAFFVGGVCGAIGINTIGPLAFLIIALLLATLTYPPIARDYAVFTKIIKRNTL